MHNHHIHTTPSSREREWESSRNRIGVATVLRKVKTDNYRKRKKVGILWLDSKTMYIDTTPSPSPSPLGSVQSLYLPPPGQFQETTI